MACLSFAWKNEWIPTPSEGHPYKNLLVSWGSPNVRASYYYYNVLQFHGLRPRHLNSFFKSQN